MMVIIDWNLFGIVIRFLDYVVDEGFNLVIVNLLMFIVILVYN